MRRRLAVQAMGLLGVAAMVAGGAAWGQEPAGLAVNAIPPGLRQKIDETAQQVLKESGVPSASVAIVRDGKIVYTQAYGDARLDPAVHATPVMDYSIGSISKQFTAAAILMLQQEGKLTLDDPVSKWLPDLTDAEQVTIRELLSHTSGYQDFWPEDYVMPPMLKPTTTEHILDTWGKKPLDFAPGTQWQYSNTGYVIAGEIAEKASGERLRKFLDEHIFTALHMDQVWTGNPAKLGPANAEGFQRYALGPPRPAPPEGPGWMFAAMELSMPAYDVAQWDISVMDRSLLEGKSYDEMETPVMLRDGTSSHYGLGLFIRELDGHLELEHDGEVSGYVAENMVFPKDKAAIVVLTNQFASGAAMTIGNELAPVVLGITKQTATAAEEQTKDLLRNFQQGKIDRSEFTPWCNAYFDQQALRDFASSLAPLGKPLEVTQTSESLRGGMVFRAFRVTFANSGRALRITTFTEPDGKLEQYLVMPSQ